MTLSTMFSLFCLVFGIIIVLLVLMYLAEVSGLYKPDTRTSEQIHHDRMEKIRQQLKKEWGIADNSDTK